MSNRNCKGCGQKIPKKNPHTKKKTQKARKYCYNCSPFRYISVQPKDRKAERRKRKEKLVKMLGGCCVQCGYNKSIRGLSFHHKDPKQKEFDISKNGNILLEWDVIIEEVKKCELLCLNCHAELHNGK